MAQKRIKSHIEKLKDKLYSPTQKIKPKPRADFYEDVHEAPVEWQKETPKPVKIRKSLLANSVFRNFFIGAIGFFIIASAFGAYMFFGGSNTVSADNIEINILGNAFVSGGEELPLKIEIVNRNNVALEYVDLLLEYQEGAGAGESLKRDRVTVGTVPAGGKTEQLVNLILFGQQGTTRDINITLEYRVSGSSSIFIKPELYVVNISSTPVNILVEGPSVTNTNQNISFDITTSLNTENAIPKMMLVVNYPPGFDFKSATPAPTFSNNTWVLGDLDKGAEKKIRINGVIVADSGTDRAFNIYTGTANPQDEQRIGTQLNSQSYVLAIEKPFIDLVLATSGSSSQEIVAQSDRMTQGEIRFTNNLETKITDVEVTAKFSGNVFDVSSVETENGFYDSSKQTIVWNSQTEEMLDEINPGDRGKLGFAFKPSVSASSSVRNPEINIEISVRGRDPSVGNTFQNITSFIKQKVKFSTSMQMTGYALYNSGPFENTGPVPAVPGQPTTYTILLSVANTTNKVSGAKVKSVLPLYVDWVGAVSPSSQSVNYDSATREVIWDIGNVEAGTGTTFSPRQVYFKVRLNPSNSQSGSNPNLLLDPTLTGKDTFTQVDIIRNMQPINTRLNRDSGYNAQNDGVQ